MTTPSAPPEPFAGKQTDTTCPNCGRNLFSGLASGNILVCRDADGAGCQRAVDPNNPDGETMAPSAAKIEDAVPSPEVGPANEAPDSTAGPGYGQAAVEEPWEPPTSAPQAVNAEDASTATKPVAPVPPPVVTPPKVEDDSTK